MAGTKFAPDSQYLSSIVSDVTSNLQIYESSDASAVDKAQALQQLTQASRRLTTATTDPVDAFSDFTFQPLANASVRVALSLGVFEHLSSLKGLTVEELASLTNAEVALTAKVVRALVTFEFAHEISAHRYTATPLGLVYSDKSRRAWATWMWDVMIHASGSIGPYYDSHPLEIPTNQLTAPFAFAYNTNDADVFEIVRRIGKLPLLGEAMAGSSQLCAEEAVSTFKFDDLVVGDDGAPLLVDIGGSRGQTIHAIRQAYPNLKGRMVLQDLQQVIDGGQIEGLDAEIQVYDFFKDTETVKGAAAYYYQRIFHDWNDEKSRMILQSLKPAMGPKSKLLICDVVVPDVRPHPRKVLRDMNMFLVGGMERSEEEWHNLLEGEGFIIEKIHGLQNPNNSIIEAKLA